MQSSIQEYIQHTIRTDAKIGYDRSVKQWTGILHHPSGSIYSQQKTKAEVMKEMEEVLEEFLVRFFEEKQSCHTAINHRVKTHDAQIPRFYQQA